MRLNILGIIETVTAKSVHSAVTRDTSWSRMKGRIEMANITVKMKDGSVREFPHEGRPGGSFTKTIRYEGAFAIITNEYYGEIAIPSNDIAEIKVFPHRS